MIPIIYYNIVFIILLSGRWLVFALAKISYYGDY
jgi:hypothetical protein